MNFNEIKYQRPDISEFKTIVLDLLEQFESIGCFEKQCEIIDEINSLRNNVLTMLTIAQIRNYTDMTNTKYIEEQKYSDEKWPLYEMVVSKYYNTLLKSKNKSKIENKYGSQLLEIAHININTVNDSVLSDLEKENKLISKYIKVLATSKTEFMGEERNISQLDVFLNSPDRNIREKASEKKYQLMNQNEKDIDSIFCDLVKVRTNIAEKLGYTSFVELGYARLSRVGYGQEEVKKFRDMIKTYIVPISTQLRENQRKRIKVDVLQYFDENLRFIDGNATPKGDEKWIIKRFKNIFKELSSETGEVFDFMEANNLLNLTTKTGKARGAFATYLCNYKSPYIFANLNGTGNDVKVLSHEFGHAFQMYVYNMRNEIPEYILPTKEACEITSIAMEYLVWPGLENLLDEDAEKYKYAHLEDAILTLPYRACIDEFQHFVYNNPKAISSEWKRKWKELEDIYMRDKSYKGNDYLERGNFWQMQSHLFKFPFYYIDYALAQICALQIWALAQTDEKEAWRVYKKLCEKGGSLSFLDLLERTILSPFDENAFNEVIDLLSTWFEKSSINESNYI
ncbi:M3 family oligoendopeptidase [Viridibacillus sp. YIM B01967]|uniref:M3 family oligoendopeptidase n=1 Tax=Viridibacillus soli TaxID=2798301 RepID=A0ABS1HAT6_9BACL|nr:M3 family oligoendopeptidase [Viridibacillus soli]MBK3496379.1 M3 family oligoendopeptidase [Viridibacillus soli]